MARIAFAWELGGEYGHAMSCAALARALHARGHSIALVFREVQQLAYLPETRAYDVFQAPRAAAEGRAAVPASLADILLGCGYADPAELTRLLGEWRALLGSWKPDLVLADFAPTAMLAARSLGLTIATFGNGFFVPPRRAPLPPFRVDEPVDERRLAAADVAALASVNTALASFAAPPLAILADQFQAAEHFLCTFPELDHYGGREASGYWGPRIRFDRGKEIAWPKRAGKRIFVYVKRALPLLDALIGWLAALPHRVVAFVPGLEPERRQRLEGPGRIVADRPVRLDGLLRECDLIVCHGGETATGALLYGVPQLLFPFHYEQYLTARRLEQVGGAAWLGVAAPPAAIGAAIEALLADPRFGRAATAFAARYRSFSPEEQRRRIVARIEELLA